MNLRGHGWHLWRLAVVIIFLRRDRASVVDAYGYLDRTAQGEPLGCPRPVADRRCDVGAACAGAALGSAAQTACLRSALLLESAEPVDGQRYVVVQQAGFGMANSFRGSVSAGVLLAAFTGRRLVVDWPDIVRNFGARAPLRLAFDRSPGAGEWWRNGSAAVPWTEAGLRKEGGAAWEGVLLDRLRGPESPRYVLSSSGGTALPRHPASRACAARIFGSACAAAPRCLAGALHRVLLGEPAPQLADRATAALATAPHDVVVGLHLRTWVEDVEGEDHGPRPESREAWASGFFACAATALRAARAAHPGARFLAYLATDDGSLRPNATAALAAADVALAFAPDAMEITHTRTWHKRGSAPRTDGGGDTAILDFYVNGEMAQYFVGTRASTFSDGIIERGCLGALAGFWQYGKSGDCRMSACGPRP